MTSLYYAILVVFSLGLASEGLASVPRPAPETSLASDATELKVARKRKRRRRKRRKRKRKSSTPAPTPVPTALEPSPEESVATESSGTEEPSTEESSADGAGEASGGDTESSWGAGDWAAPAWAGESAANSSPVSSEPLELKKDEDKEEEKKELPSRFRKHKGATGAWILAKPTYTMAFRNYQYSGSTTANLRPYEAEFVSIVGMALEAYPGVLAEIGTVDKIGLRGGYWQALGLKSTMRDDENEFSTSWNEIQAGLCGRFTFGNAMLALGADIGMLNFVLSVPSDSELARQVQNLKYVYLRAGLDVRYALGSLSILAGGAYRHVLGTGPLKDDFFPQSSALGFDGYGGVAYQMLDILEITLTAHFEQFNHSLNPASNSEYVASGATDRYLSGRTGIILFF